MVYAVWCMQHGVCSMVYANGQRPTHTREVWFPEEKEAPNLFTQVGNEEEVGVEPLPFGLLFLLCVAA